MIPRALGPLLMIVATTTVTAEPPVGHLTTWARVPAVLGEPEAGFLDLYEFDIWLNQSGESEAHVRRTGAAPYHPTTHDGYTPFDVPPGRYAALLHQPEWFVRAAVFPDIVIRTGDNPERNLTPPLDYSCVCGNNLALWKKDGGPEPWESAMTFHQTFVARGTSITHAHYKLAGHKAASTRVSIHEVSGDSPERWKQVGPERIDDKIGQLNDNWVGWRSGEVVTTPGKQYAVRIEGQNSDGERSLAMLVHRDHIGPGYAKGTGYADGRRQPYDIYATISSDSDGTCIPYMRIHDIKPGKLAGSDEWSQTWVAHGRSLAAIDFLVAWGGDQDGVTAKVTIREENPAGKVVGTPKYARTAWWGPGHGFLGATWLPGEVQLAAGKTYCATFTPAAPSTHYSASDVNHPRNAYPHGMAYRDGKSQPDIDLEMTVVEYAKPVTAPETPGVHEPKGENFVANGDFEQGEPNQDRNYDPPRWKRWQAKDTAFWYGRFGRQDNNASRIIGGSINGTSIEGGLVQAVTGLDRRKRYILSAWVRMSLLTDRNYLGAIGYDPTGQTTDPHAETVVWTAAGLRSNDWEQIVIDDIRPCSSAVSVWTHGRNNEVGGKVFTVDFDDIVLENER